jgi:hypothetical protein
MDILLILLALISEESDPRASAPVPAFEYTLTPEERAILSVACANLRAVGETHEVCE